MKLFVKKKYIYLFFLGFSLLFFRPLALMGQGSLIIADPSESHIATPLKEEEPFNTSENSILSVSTKPSFWALHMKFDLTNIILRSTHYVQAQLSPFLRVGLFQLALDFPIFINANKGGISNSYLYIYPRNYLQWINTISYGSNKDPFYLKIGTLTDISFAEGSLLHNFRNDLFDPQLRQIGAIIKFQTRYWGGKFFSAAISNFSLAGLHLYITPFNTKEGFGIFSHLKIGGVFIYDIDNLNKLYLKENEANITSHNPLSKPLYASSLYIEQPFFDNFNFSAKGALEISHINYNNSWGEIFKFLFNFSFYTLDIGLGASENGFFYNLFSALYLNPDNREKRIRSFKGAGFIYYLNNAFHFFDNKLNLQFEFYGQTQGSFSYHLMIELKPDLLAKLSLFLGLIVEDSKNLDLAFNILNNENAFIFAQIGYMITDNARILVYYKKNLYYNMSEEQTQDNNNLGLRVSLFF
jgi:hypothetical protein